MSRTSRCRVCNGTVTEFFDFGRQPLSDCFLAPGTAVEKEFYFRLATGVCGECSMVQLTEEVPREHMFHEDYPYHSSGSLYMRTHFENLAKRLLDRELTGDNPFVVEIGCNDGIMLRTLADAGIRHLGVEPSGGVADLAAAKGIRVRKSFFEESTATEILEAEGHADVIYAANTLCHIPYIGSVLSGVTRLLAPGGIFVFEDPYLLDITERTSFDQIYDEHFFFFTVQSVQYMAARHGLELVDVERLPVHGGEVRYTLAHQGARRPSPAVAELLAEEQKKKLSDMATLQRFGQNVVKVGQELTTLLRDLKDDGKRVVAYGATAKSSMITNFCGIGPELVEFVSDITPSKQGRLTPGTHIPVRPHEAFSDPYPDYALLFAWNHADEIMEKEQEFREAGGKWILYVPDVRVL
ncbi:class I SAM-dependent methyltransferase [Streptomyces sp. AK010]|uniref:class I SAM-dependent methyltransferase n=1 Tax=Streptomyces sp. AK010 TaxID=2723074 RepID=UPI001608F9C2|nr:class I SAM-dependent methyltransferase [Streptomyces sp. AK010]MBB6421401.1 methylation protein EvaC [Streptomyces sp. AK010]